MNQTARRCQRRAVLLQNVARNYKRVFVNQIAHRCHRRAVLLQRVQQSYQEGRAEEHRNVRMPTAKKKEKNKQKKVHKNHPPGAHKGKTGISGKTYQTPIYISTTSHVKLPAGILAFNLKLKFALLWIPTDCQLHPHSHIFP